MSTPNQVAVAEQRDQIKENYKRRYKHKYQQYQHTIHSAKVRMLREYYNEYLMTSQQKAFPVVSFADWITQMAEIGFLHWRDINK